MSHDGVKFISAEEAAADAERQRRRLSGDAQHVVALAQQKPGGDGRVHAPAHRDDHGWLLVVERA